MRIVFISIFASVVSLSAVVILWGLKPKTKALMRPSHFLNMQELSATLAQRLYVDLSTNAVVFSGNIEDQKFKDFYAEFTQSLRKLELFTDISLWEREKFHLLKENSRAAVKSRLIIYWENILEVIKPTVPCSSRAILSWDLTCINHLIFLKNRKKIQKITETPGYLAYVEQLRPKIYILYIKEIK